MDIDSPTHSTVFIVDDDQDMQASLEWSLRGVGYDVEIFRNGTDSLNALKATCPACIVIDLLLPGMTGLQLCEEVLSQADCACVMISGHVDVNTAVTAMKMGVVDFLEKPFKRHSLLQAVHKAVEETSNRMKQIAEEEAIAAKIATLSGRESEVFELLTKGLITKQIAKMLDISPKTVDVHRSSITQKLELNSPTQLAHVMYLSLRRGARNT